MMKKNESPRTYLFFDTETNGLPQDYNAPCSDSDNWPRMLQMAWIVTDENGNELNAREFLVDRGDDFEINADAAKIHKITAERIKQEGVSITEVLEALSADLENEPHLVAHNINFDKSIVGAEMLREGFDDAFKLFMGLIESGTCTMSQSVNFCKIPGNRYGYKWPLLSELHYKLFGTIFSGAHDAMEDTRAMTSCFWALKEKGVL